MLVKSITGQSPKQLRKKPQLSDFHFFRWKDLLKFVGKHKK